MEWNFDANQYDEKDFTALPVGEYRVRVKAVERLISKNSGNEMIKLTLTVSGSNSYLFNHIVFMQNDPAKTNQMLGVFFNSFGMTPDMNENNWVGKVGACRVKHEEYNGEMRAKVAYFLTRKKQETMPPWVEPSSGNAVGADTRQFDEIVVGDDDLPF